MTQSSLELKGSSFTLSVLHIKTTNLVQINAELKSKIAQAPHFFLGAPFIVNLSAISDSTFDLKSLKDIMREHKLVMIGVTEGSEVLTEQAKQLEIAIIHSGKTSRTSLTNIRETRVVKRNIRSGQQIYAANSDLIIFGNVSNGAEIIADGSIHVYGSLRGKAMAGAKGNSGCVIVTNSLQAELVSISGQYWLAEQFVEHAKSKNGCLIRLNNGSLNIEVMP